MRSPKPGFETWTATGSQERRAEGSARSHRGLTRHGLTAHRSRLNDRLTGSQIRSRASFGRSFRMNADHMRAAWRDFRFRAPIILGPWIDADARSAGTTREADRRAMTFFFRRVEKKGSHPDPFFTTPCLRRSSDSLRGALEQHRFRPAHVDGIWREGRFAAGCAPSCASGVATPSGTRSEGTACRFGTIPMYGWIAGRSWLMFPMWVELMRSSTCVVWPPGPWRACARPSVRRAAEKAPLFLVRRVLVDRDLQLQYGRGRRAFGASDEPLRAPPADGGDRARTLNFAIAYSGMMFAALPPLVMTRGRASAPLVAAAGASHSRC